MHIICPYIIIGANKVKNLNFIIKEYKYYFNKLQNHFKENQFKIVLMCCSWRINNENILKEKIIFSFRRNTLRLES